MELEGQQACPLFYTEVTTGGSSYCFSAPDEKASWTEASMYCLISGGVLVVIDDSEMETAVRDFITSGGKRNSGYWTAGTDAFRDGDWQWETNYGSSFEDFGYSNWAPLFPRRLEWTNCMYIDTAIGNMKWKDASCNAQKRFVCMGNTR
ncbi:hypothetical protein ScPMuIL_016068 [Solemya velum]